MAKLIERCCHHGDIARDVQSARIVSVPLHTRHVAVHVMCHCIPTPQCAHVIYENHTTCMKNILYYMYDACIHEIIYEIGVKIIPVKSHHRLQSGDGLPGAELPASLLDIGMGTRRQTVHFVH